MLISNPLPKNNNAGTSKAGEQLKLCDFEIPSLLNDKQYNVLSYQQDKIFQNHIKKISSLTHFLFLTFSPSPSPSKIYLWMTLHNREEHFMDPHEDIMIVFYLQMIQRDC